MVAVAQGSVALKAMARLIAVDLVGMAGLGICDAGVRRVVREGLTVRRTCGCGRDGGNRGILLRLCPGVRNDDGEPVFGLGQPVSRVKLENARLGVGAVDLLDTLPVRGIVAIRDRLAASRHNQRRARQSLPLVERIGHRRGRAKRRLSDKGRAAATKNGNRAIRGAQRAG